MRQKSFSSLGFDRHHKQTRRERFLAEMEIMVPWDALSALIEPHYPPGERGRPPIGIERMLRIYFLQQWFNMSDPQAEDMSDRVLLRARGFAGPSAIHRAYALTKAVNSSRATWISGPMRMA